MSFKFDNSLISQVQQATDIVDIISEHLRLEKKGRELVGLCPFHDDHAPSLCVNPVKQIFKCFACGAGGDAIKFIQLREALSFPDAIERLAKRAGIAVKPLKQYRGRSAGEQLDPKYLAKLNAWAKGIFEACLHDEHKGLKARNYLKQRKITDESVKQWSIGLTLDNWDWLAKAAGAKKISPKVLLDGGLAVAKDGGGCYDRFRNRLMFPIVDVTGRVIGFGGRTLGDDSAKYINSPATILFDKSNSLYGLDKARHEIVSNGIAVVVEGYTDVIMAHQFGCKNVVATLGTSFTTGHAKTLRRYAKRMVLVFDSDTAGIQAANRAMEVCLSERIDIALAFVDEGKDPCDYLLNSGVEAFRGVIDRAVDVMEFKWKRLLDGLEDSDNLTDRRVATEEYLRTVATAVRGGNIDPITKGLIVTKLSGIIGVDSRQINRQLAGFARRLSRAKSFAAQNQSAVTVKLGEGFSAAAEREILEVLLNRGDLFEKLAGNITTADFQVPVLRQIAAPLFELISTGGKLELAELLSRLESVEAGSAAVQLAEAGLKKANYTRRLDKAVDVIINRAKQVQKDNAKQSLGDNETDSLRKISRILSDKSTHSRRNPGMIAI